jgi:hypothetical protein
LTYLVISHLAGIVANQSGDFIAHLSELRFTDDGLEYAQLHWLAITFQQLEEFRPRSIVRDVIHDDNFGH